MKKKIKVLIVDDQALFREGLITLLSVQPDLEVVGDASNGEEALKQVVLLNPDVVLMDLRMPVMDGVTATRRIKQSNLKAEIIVLTTFDEDEDIFEGLRAGALGYLLKDITSEKLFEAIRTAARGEYFLPPAITAKVIGEFSRMMRPPRIKDETLTVGLSSRELEVLRLVSTGASNKEIADHLVIAEGTVKNHLTSILSKLEARDRMQAVIRAREIGII